MPMTIAADVQAVAAQFGVDAGLLQAVMSAEGNVLKAVQCSIPSVQTREAALRVLARSAVHAMSDWIISGGEIRRDGFVEFWAKRWAPRGAKNDPHDLNANWPANVEKF